MPQGIFSLKTVSNNQVRNTIFRSATFANWPETTTFGYFAGGRNPALVVVYTCAIDRLDFSNETFSTLANTFPLANYQGSTSQSKDYAYFHGGDPSGSNNSTIWRMDWSNEIVSAWDFLPSNRQNTSGMSGSSYNYCLGGNSGDNQIIRIDFDLDTSYLLPSLLPFNRNAGAAFGSALSGYITGGTSSCTVERLDYETETSLTLPSGSTLQAAHIYTTATQSSKYGYMAGASAPTTLKSNITRWDFSTDLRNAPGTNLTVARGRISTIETRQFGYFGGGYTPVAPLGLSYVDRIDFTTEVRTNPITLPEGRYGRLGVSGSQSIYKPVQSIGDAGYFVGGTNTATTLHNRLSYATDTVTLLPTAPTRSLPTSRWYCTGTQSANYGYVHGGIRPGPNYICLIYRMDFATEIGGNIPTILPRILARQGIVQSSAYAYSCGGISPPAAPNAISDIHRMDFTTEVMNTPGAKLHELKYDMYQSVSTPTTGYIGGGVAPTNSCSFTKLTFSTETAALIPTTFSTARYRFSATESPSYGYFFGGFAPANNCVVARLDFTTDVMQNTLTLPTTYIDGAGTKSTTDGYSAGGQITPSTTLTSNIYKINFTTETRSIITAKILPTTRNVMASFTNTV